LDVELARLAIDRHQPPEARQHALAALAMARQLAERPQYGQALTLAGDAERFGGRFASARAYYEESGRARDACGARNAAFPVVELARGIEGSMREKTITAVDSALFADAGQRAAWTEALAVVARAHGVAPPLRCALAFGADDFRFAAVAVGPDGALAGRYEPDL